MARILCFDVLLLFYLLRASRCARFFQFSQFVSSSENTPTKAQSSITTNFSRVFHRISTWERWGKKSSSTSVGGSVYADFTAISIISELWIFFFVTFFFFASFSSLTHERKKLFNFTGKWFHSLIYYLLSLLFQLDSCCSKFFSTISLLFPISNHQITKKTSIHQIFFTTFSRLHTLNTFFLRPWIQCKKYSRTKFVRISHFFMFSQILFLLFFLFLLSVILVLFELWFLFAFTILLFFLFYFGWWWGNRKNSRKTHVNMNLTVVRSRKDWRTFNAG